MIGLDLTWRLFQALLHVEVDLVQKGIYMERGCTNVGSGAERTEGRALNGRNTDGVTGENRSYCRGESNDVPSTHLMPDVRLEKPRHDAHSRHPVLDLGAAGSEGGMGGSSLRVRGAAGQQGFWDDEYPVLCLGDRSRMPVQKMGMPDESISHITHT